jgi:Zn-dependent M28 family amino/carboxypeptidase
VTGLAERLGRHVENLASEIGERHVFLPSSLAAAAAYIEREWRELGLAPVSHPFQAEGVTCLNLEADLPRTSPSGLPEVVLVGAHYDTVQSCPGADDNASGVAAMIELARMLGERPATRRAIRFAAFPNEEPPFFTTERMGSKVYAAMARRRGDRLHAMVCLESLGYYSDAPGSQSYPPGLAFFFPDRGNFLAVVGCLSQRDLVQRFHAHAAKPGLVPFECVATFPFLPGVSWSDHASFWDEGYPALMITDTAPYRNPHYHQPTDAPGTLDYPRLTRATEALAGAIHALADEP